MAASVKSATGALVSTAVLFALAVAGKGGWTAFSSDPPLKALAIATIPLVFIALFAGGNMSPGKKEDRRNRWVLGPFAIIALANAYLPAYALRMDIWTLPGYRIRWIGVVLYCVGGLLRIWPVFVLGDRFSGLVAIQPGHALETHGPYALIRHPSYLGLLVSMLGWALAFRSGVGLLLIALIFPPLDSRMSAEERLFHKYFGSEYDAYYEHTWRLIPGIY